MIASPWSKNSMHDMVGSPRDHSKNMEYKWEGYSNGHWTSLPPGDTWPTPHRLTAGTMIFFQMKGGLNSVALFRSLPPSAPNFHSKVSRQPFFNTDTFSNCSEMEVEGRLCTCSLLLATRFSSIWDVLPLLGAGHYFLGFEQKRLRVQKERLWYYICVS